jgi:hypothetical protein
VSVSVEVRKNISIVVYSISILIVMFLESTSIETSTVTVNSAKLNKEATALGRRGMVMNRSQENCLIQQSPFLPTRYGEEITRKPRPDSGRLA